MKRILINLYSNRILRKVGLAFGFFVLIMAIVVISYRPTTKVENPKFSSNNNISVKSSPYIVKTTKGSASDYVTMTDAANDNSKVNKKTISISTKEEVKLFIEKCNDGDAKIFLNADYILLGNIDCTGLDNIMPVGWKKDAPFEGKFNGDGYEISNLFLELNNNNRGRYDLNNDGLYDISYFSLFASNKGEITNLGLIDMAVSVATEIPSLYDNGVSYLVGENSGTVSGCYVVDDRDAASGVAGITASGYRIAGLVVKNTGSFTNNFISVSTLVNYNISSDVIEFAEIALTNSGTFNTNYYRDAAIVSFINGKASYVSEISNQVITNIGDYVAEYTDLLAAYSNVDGWYTNQSYNEAPDAVKTHLNFKYPIKRGIDYSDGKFIIRTIKDFLYMYELFNLDDYFAGKYLADSIPTVYEITSDIDLVGYSSELYTYKKAIGCEITGSEITNGTSTFVSNTKVNYPTIYNANIDDYSRITTSTGAECYGLFNYVSGTISNLNIQTTINFDNIFKSSSNVSAIGTICGYVEGGTIDNVNSYVEVTNTNSKDIGEYYLGGISGILGGEGTISNCTANGSFTLPTVASTFLNNNFGKAICIGGIVGYIEDSLGCLNNCTNAINIKCDLGGNGNYAIGGIVGAGATYGNIYDEANKVYYDVKDLTNFGSITVGENNNAIYSSLYVAGIIGKLNGVTHQIDGFQNYGDVKVKTIKTDNDAKVAYISGLINVAIDKNLKVSQLRTGSGQFLFYASSMVNGANVEISNYFDTSLKKVFYTNGINVNANGGFITSLSGIHNVAYKKGYNEGKLEKTSIGDQKLEVTFINQFAPVVNVIGGSKEYYSNIDTIYNLRNINYSFEKDYSSAVNLKYTGAILGQYINYKNIFNEGKLSLSLNKKIADNSKIFISGLFDELSSGCYAENLYNNGDIVVSDTIANNEKKGNLYIAGICNSNLSEITDEKQNPLNKSFNDILIGSINNAINKGKIEVKTNYEEDVTYNNSNLGSYNFRLSVYAGGVTYFNKGILSNCFNLGNIDFKLCSQESRTYIAGGITAYNEGKFAQIRDCANNGDIYVIDMSKNKSMIYASGIVGNNLYKTNNSINGLNLNQIIAFSINYGTIVSFNGADNAKSDDNTNPLEPSKIHTMSGGLLASGLCNLVNVLNYGNVYSSECAGGVAGVVDLSLYNNDTANIANTINYGKVMSVPQYYASATSTQNYSTYNDVKNLTHKQYGNIVTYTYMGAIISLYNFDNRNNVNVRYLINFFNDAAVVLYNLNPPTKENAPNVDTFITTRGKVDVFGPDGNYLTYAPLSSSKSNGDIGVFSNDFIFRKAIDGYNLDSHYLTDSYISNFFQFVRFDKINDSLLDSIGWRAMAYSNAAEGFMENVEALSNFIKDSNAQSSLEEAFEGNTWVENCNTTLLDNLIKTSMNNNELNNYIQTLLEYLFFDETAKTDFSSSIRSDVITKILKYYEDKGNTDYYELLNSLLYDQLLANIVSTNNSDYETILNKIHEVMKSSDNLETIMNSYISLLENEKNENTLDENSILYPLFDNNTGSKYTKAKITLIETLLEGYDDDSLQQIFESIISPTTIDDKTKYLIYLMKNSDVSSDIYKHLISYNTFENDSYLAYVNSLIKVDLSSNIDSIKTFNDNNFNTSELGDKKVDDVTPILDSSNSYTQNYNDLWALIKDNSEIQKIISANFKNYNNPTTGAAESGILAKATENTNTYQSNDEPQSKNEINKNNSTTYPNVGICYSYNGNSVYESKANGGFDNEKPINTRFIYTPDDVVSYGTYFYGPYDKTGNVFNAGGNLSSGNRNYNIGFALNSVSAISLSSGTKRDLVPVFIGLNEDLVKNKIANSGTTSGNTNLYEFYWNNYNDYDKSDYTSDFHWKYSAFLTDKPDNTKGYIYKKTIDDKGYLNKDGSYTKVNVDYLRDGYDFDPTYTFTKNIDHDYITSVHDKNNNKIEVGLVNGTGSSHTYKDDYLTAYCTAAMITGIWYSYSIWANNEKYLTSLIAKIDDSGAFSGTTDKLNGYYGVFTTEYMCYHMNDILALDGLRTKGMSGNIVDNDETSIISSIVTNILSTDDGKKAVLNAIAEYGKIKGFKKTDNATANMLLSCLGDTAYAQEAVLNYIETIIKTNIETNKDFNYDNDKTVKQFLISKNITIDNVKEKIIAYSSTNLSNFRGLLLVLFKYSDYYNTYNYERNDTTKWILNYVKYLYGIDDDMTDEDISNILASAKDSDLEYIKNLFSTTIDTSKFFETSNSDGITANKFAVYTKESGYNMDSNYDRCLVALNGATLNLTTGNNSTGYEIEIMYEGTIDGITHNNVSLKTIALSSNKEFNLDVTKDTKIYSIKLYQNEYTYTTGNGEMVSTINSDNLKGNTGTIALENNIIKCTSESNQNSTFAGYISPTFTNNLSYNNGKSSITIVGNSTLDTNFSFAIGIGNLTNTIDSSTFGNFTTTFNNVSNEILNSESFKISINYSRNNYNNNPTSQNVNITSIKLNTEFELENGIKVTYVLDLLNSNNNKATLESTGDLKVDVKEGPSGSSNRYTINGKQEISFTTTPLYFTAVEPKKKTNEFNINSINISKKAISFANNFNNHYDKIGTLFKDLSKSEISTYTNYSTIELSRPSYVMVKAKNTTVGTTGSIGINGTLYDMQDESKYYGYYLNAGTYAINNINATIENILVVDEEASISSTKDGDIDIIIFNDGVGSNTLSIDYSSIGDFKINNCISKSLEEMTKYQTYIETYYAYRKTNDKVNRKNDCLSSILTLFPTITEKNNEKIYRTIFKDPKWTNDDLKELIELILKADNDTKESFLGKIIDSINDQAFYKELINSLTSKEMKVNLVNKLLALSKDTENNLTNEMNYIYAAYLGYDYSNNQNELNKTKMHEILDKYEEGKYQYINDKGEIDSDKFISLVEHLSNSSEINLSGYGIYALSSSKGILNGTFIPDNYDFESMNPKYDEDHYLSDNTSNAWCGASDNLTEGTVMYAFIHDMKQLKLNIATTVFDLDLKVDNDTTLKSSEEQITSNTITYYVSQTIFDKLSNDNSLNLQIINRKLSEGATDDKVTTICSSSSKIIKNENEITIDNAYLVKAEDRTVMTNYTIVFVKLDLTENSYLSIDKDNISYSGDTIKLTYTNSKLPNGMDVKQFLTIKNGNTIYESYDSTNDIEYWYFDNVDNNGVINNGTSTITIVIKTELPHGDINFTVDVYGNVNDCTCKKAANTEAKITEFFYNGDLKDKWDNNYTQNTDILFGRAFNYTDLTDPTSANFYLYKFNYSANATIKIDAEIQTPNGDSISNLSEYSGRIMYVVTFEITSEDGNNSNTYVHTLTEMEYYKNDARYANLFANGTSVNEKPNNYNELTENQRPYNLSNGKFKYSNDDNCYMEVSFNRGVDPQYRAKYDLTNFFTFGSNVYYTVSGTNDIIPSESYRGITVTVSNNADTGKYIFTYTYNNTGIWENDTEYVRSYTFPELRINKLPSTDALLKQLTFLNESIVTGNSVSVMKATNAIIPDGKTGDANSYSNDDLEYSKAFNNTDIRIRGTGITYNASAATNITDYYALGSVSDVDLTFFAPTFKINQYAQIYQYTTKSKLNNYNSTNKVPDTTILSNHNTDNTVYLYVPFISSQTGKEEVFLISLGDKNKWMKIYMTDDTNTSIVDISGKNVSAKDAVEKQLSFTYGGIKYTISSSCGKTSNSNSSLYMNYIGTPQDGHFWYVSYVVFSEDYLNNNSTAGNIRYYHISIIDATNTVNFNVTLYAPDGFSLEQIYIVIAENIYSKENDAFVKSSSKQVGAYVTKSTESITSPFDNTKILYKYILNYRIQSLPKGYFYFMADLPDGYNLLAYTDKDNQYKTKNDQWGGDEEGSFLPYTSLLPITVSLDLYVVSGNSTGSSSWGLTTSTVYSRTASYNGLIDDIGKEEITA